MPGPDPDSSKTDKCVFFVHVMKTGGTTVGMTLNKHFRDEERYPNSGWGAVQGQKWNCERFLAQSPDQLERLRWISAHVPLSVALRYGQLNKTPLHIACLLRDGTARAISHLLQISKRLQFRYSYRELLDTPLVGEFFLSNHQTRALGVSEDGWREWDRCFAALVDLPGYLESPGSLGPVATVRQAQFDSARASLDFVDALGVQADFDDWWQRCAGRFGWPERSVPAVNVGAHQDGPAPPDIPDDVRKELHERNALDTALHDSAVELLAQQRLQ